MKTSHRGFIVPLLLALIALLLAGGGAYVYTQKKQVNPPIMGEAPLPQATSTTQTLNAKTANWKTYTNSQYGFELKYPPTINAGKLSANSSLSIAGIYIGPLVFVVADDETIQVKARTYFNRYWEAAQSEKPRGDEEQLTLSCRSKVVQNSPALIRVVYCTGGGGPAAYATIEEGNNYIFVDGYSIGFPATNSLRNSLLDVLGYLSNEEIEEVLSSFRFTK